MRRLKAGQQIAYQLGLALVALFVLVPAWGMVRLALDGAIKGAPTEFRLWPEQFTLAIFRHVWENPSQSLALPGLLKNSLIVSGGAALSSVALGASMDNNPLYNHSYSKSFSNTLRALSSIYS